jgi:Phospholipase_D-nuclease N-terminal
MPRLWVILIIVDVAFTIFTFVDVILTQNWRIRGVPKAVWLVIVLLFSPLGGVLWFFVGKEKLDRASPVAHRNAPDDDPAFLNNLRRDEERDERIRRLEQQLSELDDDPPKE